MKTKEILKTFNWSDVFGNSSQTENMYDFLKGYISLEEFREGFYPGSKNKRLAKELTLKQCSEFRKHAKKLFNLSSVQAFGDGNEGKRRREYLSKL